MARMTGKRALMEQLRADGVKHVFGNPGTTEQGFMDILQDYPDIQFMLALHEGVAVSMADAYARLTRRPSFLEVHTAPGLGNAMGMLHNARIGQTPLVAYAGHSESRALFQEPHLSGPLVDMAKPICKWAYQVEHAHDVPQALRRAFKLADEPPQGPVFLSLPMDVLDQEADMDVQPTSFTRWHTRPDQGAIEEAARLLREAKNPKIMLGDGVNLAGGQAEAIAVAEMLGAPLFECYASEYNAPLDHPLHMGAVDFVYPRRIQATLADCDVLLVVGAPLFQLIFPDPEAFPLPKTTKLIQIDANSWQIGRNVPASIGILSDAKGALAELAEALQRQRTPADRDTAERRSKDISAGVAAARQRYFANAREHWNDVPITAARLMSEIKDAFPENYYVFSEAVTNGAALERYITAEDGARVTRVRGGGIGGGLPGALGAALAKPDHKMVGISADGSAMYGITALWTAAHHRIPVTYVMLHNGSYRILKQNMLQYLGEGAKGRQFVAMDLTDPDLRFDRMAESMGVPAWRVERPDELAPALREAMAAGPALVDVVIEGTV
ncbi:MAG: thiamine pyrophosphate-binding protein [Chloroflexi bacterium]|nr:thiamine pyrophosphate-binding protein [Chloroflexota bacterium]